MRRLAIGALVAFGGYVVAATLGYLLVEGLSTNTHDRSLEAAMTAAFVAGPIGAVVGFVIGFIRGGRRSPDARTSSSQP